jgi:23S rRNA (uracil1939-C5)-methyltransferase
MQIDSLGHDGRGVAHLDEKVIFVDGALPGEEVMAVYTRLHRKYDEARVEQVLKPSESRVEPGCEHFAICGGCSLQHMDPVKQIHFKQDILLENFERIGGVRPDAVLPPLTGPHWGYRRKARLGVKYVTKKERVLVGFREKRCPYLADIRQCEVLYPAVGKMIDELAQLVSRLQAYKQIAQIEVAVSDNETALVFRNLEQLCDEDREELCRFAQAHDFHILLQPGGPATVTPLWPEQIDLSYRLDAYGVELHFNPTDFTQVNYEINRKMVDQALGLLELQPQDRVLDLFCGIGNFTLPMATRAGHVTGVEGGLEMVTRATSNAALNNIANAEFHVANLTEDMQAVPWYGEQYDKILIDPPRSGAAEIIAQMAALKAERIVYVSCHPGSLARDAGELVNNHGYRLEVAG